MKHMINGCVLAQRHPFEVILIALRNEICKVKPAIYSLVYIFIYSSERDLVMLLHMWNITANVVTYVVCNPEM